MELAVVGGGIAGLAGTREARLEAGRLGLDLRVTLIEAGDRLGGKVLTETEDGMPLEWGPDSFLASKPWAQTLVEDLGMADQLVATGPAAGRAHVLLDGELRPIPPGVVMGIPTTSRAAMALAAAGIVPRASAVRAATESFRPGGPIRPDETVASVAQRRLGRRLTARLVGPLIEGVFGAPGDEVGVASALPEAVGSRSLVAAVRRRPRHAGPAFLTLRGGMGALVEALVHDLQGTRILTGAEAKSVAPRNEGFVVRTGRGDVEADLVLLAAPARTSAALLAQLAPEAAAALGRIRYSRSGVILLRYAPGQIGRPLDGSGYLAGPGHDGIVAACTWIPAKWPHLPQENLWLRAVATAADALALDDRELGERVATEVGRVMRAGSPTEIRAHRWHEALPVLGPGHAGLLQEAGRSLPRSIALAGAYVGGVGLPDCIRTGQEGARDLVRVLASRE